MSLNSHFSQSARKGKTNYFSYTIRHDFYWRGSWVEIECADMRMNYSAIYWELATTALPITKYVVNAPGCRAVVLSSIPGVDRKMRISFSCWFSVLRMAQLRRRSGRTIAMAVCIKKNYRAKIKTIFTLFWWNVWMIDIAVSYWPTAACNTFDFVFPPWIS